MTTKAYSLWVYDRHCSLIFHHDWSISPSSLFEPGADLLPEVSRCVQTGIRNQGRGNMSASSSTSKLSLSEHAKLIYGLVFSLRNMLGKLSTSSDAKTNSQFNTYTTPTYSFAHLQTPSMYTFVLLTDPVRPPSRALPGQRGGYDSSSSSSGLSGGGIPGTGGMSLPGVLHQIVSGPWIEWVVKNPACSSESGGGLESQEVGDDDANSDDSDEEEEEEAGAADGEAKVATGRRQAQIQKIIRRRGVDSDGFRAGIEAVLLQNKLSVTGFT